MFIHNTHKLVSVIYNHYLCVAYMRGKINMMVCRRQYERGGSIKENKLS